MMETKTINNPRIHQGNNIRTSRLKNNLTQVALAALANIPQSTLSKAESSKFVEDELLQKLSKAMDVPFEYLREAEQGATTIIFENNKVTNKDSTVNGPAGTGNQHFENYTNVFDPVEKMAELYERLLATKDEKYADLEKRLQDLEEKK